MSDHFEWKKDDLEQLKIGNHEFIDYLREGLIPYTRNGKTPIPCPKEYHEYRYPYRFNNSNNKYSDPCLFFNTLQKAKAQIRKKRKEDSYLIVWKTPCMIYALNLSAIKRRKALTLWSHIKILKK